MFFGVCYFALNIPLFFHNFIPFRSRSRPFFYGSGSGSEQTVSAAPAPAPAPTKMCRLRRLRLRLRLRLRIPASNDPCRLLGPLNELHGAHVVFRCPGLSPGACCPGCSPPPIRLLPLPTAADSRRVTGSRRQGMTSRPADQYLLQCVLEMRRLLPGRPAAGRGVGGVATERPSDTRPAL